MEDFKNLDKVTNEEIEKEQKIIRLENEDKKEDAQRAMAWFSLFGMLLYPFAVILAELSGLSGAVITLGSMAGTYFVSVAAIVMAFFGAQAWSKKNSENTEEE